MKISNSFLIGISVLALSLYSCDIEKPYETISGVDKSKAMPLNVTLDEDNISATGISVYWDGLEATQSGALSFTVQLVEKMGVAGDNYNKTLSLTSASLDDVGNVNDVASFNSLTKGNSYYVRVRANYAYSVYSDWAYLQKDGTPMKYMIGFGFVYPEFVAPNEFKAKALTYGSILASWAVVEPAVGYELEYQLEGAGEEWKLAADTKETSVKFTGLTENSNYTVRVRAYRFLGEEGTEREYTEYTTLTDVVTPVKPEFNPEITDSEQFLRFVEEIAAQSGSDDVYKLMNDIDLNGAAIIAAENFFGILDGQNFKIKNANFIASSLFAQNEGVVKNIVIDESCTAIAADGAWGILVALNKGTVENCVNNAAITIENYTTAIKVGAIVGATSGVVKDCINNGNISFNGDSVGSNGLIGGIVGAMGGEQDEVLILNCINNGNIKLNNSTKTKNSHIGGILGGTNITKLSDATPKNNGTIKSCTNNGSISHAWVEKDSGSYFNLGGVVGYLEGDIVDCHNKGNLSVSCPTDNASASTRPALGGVAAAVLYNITDCTNTGEISMEGCFSAGTQGAAGAMGYQNPSVGGVVAILGGDQKYGPKTNECIASGLVNEGKIITNFVQKTGGGTNSAVGGVIGWANTPIKDCVNKGKLEFGHGAKTQRMGGVVGASYLGVTNCRNEGSLTFDAKGGSDYRDKTGYASYQNYIGGIVGYPWAAQSIVDCTNETGATIRFINGWASAVLNYIGGISGSYSGSQVMTNCHNKADVIVESTDGVCLCVGGVSGAFNGNMTSCSHFGNVTVSTGAPAAGKEHEVGGLIGYTNANVTNCTVQGVVTNNTSGTFAGGLLGGFGETSARQISGCTINAEVKGTATLGSLLGQFRKAGSHTLWYKDCTISDTTLPLCGNLRGNSVTEGEVPAN